MGILEVIAKRYRICFEGNGNVLKLIMVRNAQFCKYITIHLIGYFKWVNCKVCIFCELQTFPGDWEILTLWTWLQHYYTYIAIIPLHTHTHTHKHTENTLIHTSLLIDYTLGSDKICNWTQAVSIQIPHFSFLHHAVSIRQSFYLLIYRIVRTIWLFNIMWKIATECVLCCP